MYNINNNNSNNTVFIINNNVNGYAKKILSIFNYTQIVKLKNV